MVKLDKFFVTDQRNYIATATKILLLIGPKKGFFTFMMLRRQKNVR